MGTVIHENELPYTSPNCDIGIKLLAIKISYFASSKYVALISEGCP
jgi:hypothetical protein